VRFEAALFSETGLPRLPHVQRGPGQEQHEVLQVTAEVGLVGSGEMANGWLFLPGRPVKHLVSRKGQLPSRMPCSSWSRSIERAVQEELNGLGVLMEAAQGLLGLELRQALAVQQRPGGKGTGRTVATQVMLVREARRGCRRCPLVRALPDRGFRGILQGQAVRRCRSTSSRSSRADW